MQPDIAERILAYRREHELLTRDTIDRLLHIQYPDGFLRHAPKVPLNRLGHYAALAEANRLVQKAEEIERAEEARELQAILNNHARKSLDHMSVEEQRQQWLQAQGIEPELAPYIDTSKFHPALFYPHGN